MNSKDHFQLVEAQHNTDVKDLKQSLEQYHQLLQEMGVETNADVAATSSRSIAAGSPNGEQVSVSTHWWGIDIVMNEKLTQDIIAGITGGGAVGGLIASAFGAAGVVTGGVATVIGAAIAAIVALKIAEIKIVDNGKGVHWPITWIQWGLLLAAVPTGPAGIIAAGMAFIHPLRN